MDKKWLAPILPYLAIWTGLFLFKSAWLALAGFHLAILFALFIARPALPINLLFKSKRPKLILANILLCGGSGILLYFFWDRFGIASDLSSQLDVIGLNSSSWPAFIIYFSCVNSFIEEFFWRGFLGNDIKTLAIGDFIFAGYHMLVLYGKVPPLSILLVFVLLVTAGWFWRQIRREDEGLLAPTLGHMAADFSILICVMLNTL